ncbi:MAG TPA: hypothetical protein VE029_04560 [Rhizobacter sp.]|nr:hypothetical protein [Rhizobacter sp.]
MTPLSQFAVGLAVTFLFSFGAKPVQKLAKRHMLLHPPSDRLKAQWELLANTNEGGAILGWLERFMFFGALSADASLLIGAWLAFKVASKWQAWSGVIAVPSTIEGLDPIDYLIARRSWGSHLLMTFLVGTAYNVLVALLAIAVGRYWQELHAFFEAICR